MDRGVSTTKVVFSSKNTKYYLRVGVILKNMLLICPKNQHVMKKIVLRYGTYAGIFELITFVLTWLLIDITHIDHKVQGAIGYVTIISPLVFVYFGIRYFRDRVNNGSITFLKALQVGLLIVIIPTVSFAIIETVYVLYIDPHFYENIAKYDIEQYRKILPPAAFAAKVKEINAEVAMNNNIVYNFIGMILTIGALGTIVTLISSVILRKKPQHQPVTENV